MEVKNKNLVSVVLTITVALSMVLPTPLIVVGEAEDGRDYFFVEFTDCPAGWMKEEIYKLDGVLHQYYHRNMFLIEIDAAKIGAVKVLPFVSNVELYQPAYKMHSDLIDRSGKKDLIVTLFDGADVEHTATRFTERGAQIHKVHTEVTNLIQCSIDISLISDIAQIKEVLWIEEDFEPVTFMNLITSNPYMGHDTPQAAGFNGSGSNILGEVQDNGCNFNHPDLMILWTDGSVSVESHGTCTTGIVFSSGAGDIDAQGIVYGGTGAFADFGTGRGTSITNLWNGNFNEGNAGMNGVFQSNSWGSALQNGQYTTYSNQDDAAANAYPHVLALWAMGNGNDGTSEGLFNPDAAAKNVVGVGAVSHKNTATLLDDEWQNGGVGNTPSRGPAADGRQKPDLCGPFDWIYTTDIIGIAGYSSGNYHDNFGGTSGATPIVAGSAGLIYDLYQQSFFDNNPAGNWPYSSTVKALLIADAYQYSLTNATRNEQGWGTPDLEYTYNLGAGYHVIDEYPQALDAGDTWNRTVYVDGTYPLKITLTWIDPAAPETTGSEEALINNLDLKVTAPDSTVYWGNNGLFNNLWSASGTGLNHWTQSSGYRDDLNNVENVFVQSPQTGNWMIEVFGRTGDLPDGPQNFSLIASGASNIVPSATVDFPTVPDTILSGLVDVLWTATDVEDGTDLDIMIQYSPDGGSSWITLETSPIGPPYNNDGIYSWDTTTVLDGVNYLTKVEATDSVVMAGSDISDTPFSIDNMPIAPPGPEAEWFFQIQATGPNMDLDMKPVELTPNSVQSADLSAAGQYLIGTWESIEAFTGANINGPWTFNVYGYTTDPEAMVGYLYGKIFASSDLVTPLDTTILDNKNVGAYSSSYLFTWTDSLSGNIPDGDSLIVEIWLDVSTGSGGPGSTIYNYVGVTQAGGPHDAYFYDCNAMSSTGPDMGLGPPANEIYELTDTEYGNVSTSDDVWAISVDPGAFDETFTWCDVQVAEDLATITQISMTFEGQAATATDFQIWAFNLATATWGQIGTAVSVGANTDIAFTRSITANCADYISGTGLLTWGCYQTDSSDLIRVDYLEATITYFQPYPNFVMEFDYGDTQSNVVPYINTGPPPTYDIDLTGVAVDTWVFVSFPITAIGDVPTVFNDTSWGDGGTTWDYIQWYDNSAREWKSYATYKPASVNDMDIIDNAAGFWIHITANGGNQKLTVGTGVMPAGPVFINLYAGWNLVGYPSATPQTADIALQGTGADMIAVYNATAPYRITDVPSIQFNTVTMLEGNAYWVHVTTDTTWTVGL